VLPEQRRQLDLVHKLNELPQQESQKDAQLEAAPRSLRNGVQNADRSDRRIRLTKEPQTVRDLYGTSRQANQLLIARRLARTRRSLRARSGPVDGIITRTLKIAARRAPRNRSTARRVHRDLKQRGLFDSTLVIWGGEFGRKPVRDRNGNDNPVAIIIRTHSRLSWPAAA
jgi:hypothetical protein